LTYGRSIYYGDVFTAAPPKADGPHIFHNDGSIAGYFDDERIGKAMTDTEQDLAGSHLPALVQAVQRGERFSFTRYVSRFKEDMQFISVPFVVGNTASPWSLMVGISTRVASASLYRLLFISIIICAVTIAMIAIGALFVARSISRPLGLYHDGSQRHCRRRPHQRDRPQFP
jgi:hypothetical protein